MKAAVYYGPGPPDVLRYQDVAEPSMSDSEVLVEVRAASVEGSDLLLRQWGPLWTTPQIGGTQCAGVVRAVGGAVKTRRAGERVAVLMPLGCYAELVAVPENLTWTLPDSGSLPELACVPIPFGTADECLFRVGRLAEGESVLVTGAAGGVGLAAVQLASRGGATVVAAASSKAKHVLLEEFGAHHVIDYAADTWPAAVQEATGGRGVDVVLDIVGGQTLQRALECLAPEGRAVSAGTAGRDRDLRFDLSPLKRQSASLSCVSLTGRLVSPQGHALIDRMLGEVGAGRLRMPIDRAFPLADAAAAHAYVESRRARGRVILIPGSTRSVKA